MREYRVWCKNKNKWEEDAVLMDTEGDLYYINDNGLVTIEKDTYIIENYTGRKDKNGVKIFEGDIIKTKYHIVLIKWTNTGFIPYRSMDFKYSKVTNWDSVRNGDVIGNIHDNKELLEGK